MTTLFGCTTTGTSLMMIELGAAGPGFNGAAASEPPLLGLSGPSSGVPSEPVVGGEGGLTGVGIPGTSG